MLPEELPELLLRFELLEEYVGWEELPEDVCRGGGGADVGGLLREGARLDATGALPVAGREVVGARAVVLADLLRLEPGSEYLFELLGVELVIGAVVLELVDGRELLLEMMGA